MLVQKTTHSSLNNMPVTFKSAKGAFVYDMNNKKYIDFMNGKGSIILGHNPSELISDLINYLTNGLDVRSGFTEPVFQLNQQIKKATGYNKLAYFKTGTEAVRAAVCSAKTYTNKQIILSSGYHGYDPFWKFHGELGEANKNGIVDFFFDLTLLKKLLNKYKNQISAVIISPDPIYLNNEWFNKFNDLIKNENILLIIDEVKVGFRYNFGLYTANYNLKPDIVIISKAIGNGFPISAVCGHEEFMQGCTNLNYTCFFDSLTFFAASKVMKMLYEKDFYKKLDQISMNIIDIINGLINEFELPISIVHNSSIFQFVFPDKECSDVFFHESILKGLIFYPGDNQCLSYSFADEELCFDLRKNFSELFKAIKKNPIFKKGRKPTLEWEIQTAWALMDGLPYIEIPDELKKKLLMELPE